MLGTQTIARPIHPVPQTVEEVHDYMKGFIHRLHNYIGDDDSRRWYLMGVTHSMTDFIPAGLYRQVSARYDIDKWFPRPYQVEAYHEEALAMNQEVEDYLDKKLEPGEPDPRD
jgi:hypothetical protein